MAMSQPRPPDICYLCLTNDRMTFGVSQKIKAVFSFVTCFHYHIQFVEARVCWECKALLEKFQRFKERAELATRALEEARWTKQPVNVKSLSNLEKTRLVVIDILTYVGEKESAPKNIQSLPRHSVPAISNKNKEQNKEITYIGGKESATKNIQSLPRHSVPAISNKNKEQKKEITYIGGKESATKNIQSLPIHSMHTISNKNKEHEKNYKEDENVINIDDDDDIECVPVKAVDNDKIGSKQKKNQLQPETNDKNDEQVINIEDDIAIEPEMISENCVDDASDDDSLSSDNLNEPDDPKSNNNEVDNCNDDSNYGNSDIEYVGSSSDSESKGAIEKTTKPLEILFIDTPIISTDEGQEKVQMKILNNDCENGTDTTQNSMAPPEETSSATVQMFVLNEPMIPLLVNEDKKAKLTNIVVDTPPKTKEAMSQTDKEILIKGKSKLRTVRIKQSNNDKEIANKINSKVVDTQNVNANNKKNSNLLEYQQPENCLIAIEASIAEGRCERYRGTLADVEKLRECYRSIRTGTPVCVQCIDIFDSPEALYQHISIRHFQEGEFICEICSCRFSEKDKLSAHVDSHYAMFRCKGPDCQYMDTCAIRTHRHVSTAHAGFKSFNSSNECKFCGGVFTSRQYYLIHLKRHLSGQKYICDYCQKQYDSRTQLSHHITRLHLAVKGKRRQICETCGKSVLNYTNHLRVHRIYRCRKCKTDFDSKDDLSKHNSTHKNGAYKCDICHEKFHLLVQKDIHVKRHTDPYPYKCKLCNASFSEKTKLTEHSYCHKDMKHACIICNKTFIYKYKLSLHMKSHLNEDAKPRLSIIRRTCHLCDQCHKQFTTAQDLSDHRKTHTSQQNYQCHHCRKVFWTRLQIQQHMRLHPFKVKCDICRKEFQDQRCLNFHALLHLDPSQRQIQIEKEDKINPDVHICNICGETFLTYENLHSHYAIHINKLPFKCDVCDQTFKFKSMLYHHQLRHTGIKPYKCKLCGARFTYKAILINHLKSHSDEKQFKCGECDLSFKYYSGLWDHKRIHKGEKPHQCYICGARFTQKGNLTGHMKTHTKERPFECTLCGKKFPWRRNLKNHYKVHAKKGESPGSSVETLLIPVSHC